MTEAENLAADQAPSSEPAPATPPAEKPPTWKQRALAPWQNLREVLRSARPESGLFVFGVALLWLTGFNDYHGLALSSKLPFLRLDVGYLFIAAAAGLFLTRTSAPRPEPIGGLGWAGFVLFAVGSGAALLTHLTSFLSDLSVGGVFLPDLAVVVGGALFASRTLRLGWSGGLVRGGFALLVAGLVATLAYAYLTRGPLHAALASHFASSATETLLSGAALTGNGSALGGGATAASAALLEAARAVGENGPARIVVGYLAVLALAGLVLLVVAGLRAGRRTRLPNRFWSEGGFLVVALGALLFLPTLDAFGFYDPWEGHYAEVARQMVWRDDWVSLFWENNWFWSKPVGIFWMMAVAFKGLGATDLVARLPFAITGLVGMVFVYHFCRKLWSARSGVIAALILGTFPQFLFISRQVMTDVPVVVLTIIGVGCLILALFARHDDEEEHAPLTLLFLALFAATTFPQYSMVAAELERYGFAHALLYVLPWIGIILTMGRARSARQIYAYAFFWSVGLGCLAKGLIAPGLPVLVLLAYLVISGRWGDLFSPRRLALGFAVSAIVFGGLVLIVKGVHKIPGNGLLVSSFIASAFVGLLGIGATARGGVWSRLEVGRGLVIFFLTTLPWYVAMAARHGGAQLDATSFSGFRLTGFLHEFFIQHHFDRLGGGVHGDTGTTFDYFIRWGAYAVFPWIGFVPGALSRFWSGRRELDPASGPGAGAKLFVFLWFAVFFTLFTLSATKFHHYILPALPPLAIMLGVWLDRAASDSRELTRPILAGAVALVIFVGWDLYRTPQTFFNSFTYVFSGRSYPWPTNVMPEGFLRLVILTLSAVLALGLMPRTVFSAPRRRQVIAWGLPFVFLAAAIVIQQTSPVSLKLLSAPPEKIGVYRDALAAVMPTPPGNVWSEYVKVYPHDAWYHLRLVGRLADFGFGTLAAFFAIIAFAGLYAVGRRRIAVFLFGGVAYVFSFWLAHQYMVELGPHSGQRHMWAAYYSRRGSPNEKLCAYMMNWRSEHWYSHNEVIVGLSDPPLINMARQAGRQWIITERSRIGDVRSLLQQRNGICRGIFEWDISSNRYALLSVEDAPDDPSVKSCLERQRPK